MVIGVAVNAFIEEVKENERESTPPTAQAPAAQPPANLWIERAEDAAMRAGLRYRREIGRQSGLEIDWAMFRQGVQLLDGESRPAQFVYFTGYKATILGTKVDSELRIAIACDGEPPTCSYLSHNGL
jgi:hypothetical protein